MGQQRCRYCGGRGTVWVIVSRKQAWSIFLLPTLYVWVAGERDVVPS